MAGGGAALHGPECTASLAALTDADLLGAWLGGPRPTRRSARRLLRLTGGFAPLMLGLADAAAGVDERRLRAQVVLAGEIARRALAQQLSRGPLLDSPDSVRDWLRASIGTRPHEVFCVLFLDARHHLLRAEEMFRGTVSQTSVYPREVVRRSLELNASSVILAHNHPSGLAEPSAADRRLTEALQGALALIDVQVLDHLVVTREAVCSFAERGLI